MRRVVAVREAVEHPGRALGAAVAGVRSSSAAKGLRRGDFNSSAAAWTSSPISQCPV